MIQKNPQNITWSEKIQVPEDTNIVMKKQKHSLTMDTDIYEKYKVSYGIILSNFGADRGGRRENGVKI